MKSNPERILNPLPISLIGLAGHIPFDPKVHGVAGMGCK
jgi:hypothetical protein